MTGVSGRPRKDTTPTKPKPTQPGLLPGRRVESTDNDTGNSSQTLVPDSPLGDLQKNGTSSEAPP